MKLNADVKEDINKFATEIAKMNGFDVPHGYDFELCLDSKSRMFWNLSKASYNFWSLKFKRS